MNLKQLWSIIRGRRTNFSWMNASWTYYPDGDPLGKILMAKTGGDTESKWDKVTQKLHMPDDLIVVRNRDADEAGDYRIMKHSEAVGNPQWEITDIDPNDLD